MYSPRPHDGKDRSFCSCRTYVRTCLGRLPGRRRPPWTETTGQRGESEMAKTAAWAGPPWPWRRSLTLHGCGVGRLSLGDGRLDLHGCCRGVRIAMERSVAALGGGDTNRRRVRASQRWAVLASRAATNRQAARASFPRKHGAKYMYMC
jgi:hypothetical protein